MPDREVSLSEAFCAELQAFLEKRIPELLVEASKNFTSSSPWEMPIIDDFIVAIAVRDLKDGDGTIVSFTSKDSPTYRIRGLLHEILGQ